MKNRLPFLAGAAVGYVLGTKAGRERYEQIVQASRKVSEHPTVQEYAGVVRTKSTELAGTAKERAGGLSERVTKRQGSEQEVSAPSGTPSGTPAPKPTPPASTGTPTSRPSGSPGTSSGSSGTPTAGSTGSTGSSGARSDRL